MNYSIPFEMVVYHGKKVTNITKLQLIQHGNGLNNIEIIPDSNGWTALKISVVSPE